MRPIEAPVTGVKVFRVTDCGLLQSPYAYCIWPAVNSGYCSTRGFFFWAFPNEWHNYLAPPRGAVLAVVKVLPSKTRRLISVDPFGVTQKWPNYLPELPKRVDAVCARNLVGIARAIRIELLIGRANDFDGSQLQRKLEQYAPLRLVEEQRPCILCGSCCWEVYGASSGDCPLLESDYYWVRLPSEHKLRRWRCRKTRTMTVSVVESVLRKNE
ncbi:MAG: hypothetical protein KatS3mg087_1069 [Patescibacteria group bacterium]|nr:MAG: hypothetical protein KatS3mg087_1069 [Patescibacteria group bacterium]